MLSKPWRILPLLGCGFLTACSCAPSTLGALRVVTTVDAALPADCFELEVQSGGSVLASTTFDRVAGQTEYLVAALQGDLPATVDLQTRAYLGKCSDRLTRRLNGRSEVVQGTFPKKGINEARLTVGLPDTTLDADQDGYVDAAQGGVDCDDHNAQVHPFQAQLCTSPLDTNCDGKVGCNDPDCMTQPACSGVPPTLLAFSPNGISVHTNDCSSALTLEVRSAAGLAPVGQQTTVALSFSGTPVQLFSDAACTGTPATQVVLPFGTATQALYARGAVVGTATVTASSGTLTNASALVTIDPQPVAGLAFITAARTITAGGCSAELTVQAQDSLGRATIVTSPMALSLSGAPSQGLVFYDATDTACAIPRTSVSLAAGTDSIGFRVSGTRAGPTQLTAAGGLFTAQQTLTITPGSVSGLGFSSPPPGVQAAVCSGAPVTVQLQDSYGNAAPTASAATVSLSFSGGPGGGALTFYPAAGCAAGTQSTTATIAAGQSSVSVYLVGSVVGAYTMQADSGGHTATQQATISSGPPDHLAFASAPVTVTAGGCSPVPVRVQAQDSTNAPSGVQALVSVTLAQTPAAAASLYSDVGCTTALAGGNTLDIPLGNTEASFYFRGTVARTFRVDATASGFAAANQNETIQPGSPNTLQWNPNPTVLSADAGTCAGPFALDIMDLNGNPTSFGAVTVLTPNAASSTTGATLSFAAGATCSPTGASVSIGATAQSVSFYATTTRVAAYTVSASTPSVSAAGTASLAVGPAAPDRLIITSAPPSSVIAGTCLNVTVERRDPYGNPVPVSAPLTLNLSSAGGPALSFFATPGACPLGTTSTTASISAGASTTFAVRGTVVGAGAIVAVDSPGLSTANFTLAITPAAATQLVLSPVAATVNAGQCVAFTEERRDTFINPAPDNSPLAVTLSGSGPAATSLGFFSDSGCTTVAANGDLPANVATRTLYFKSTAAGALTVTATSALSVPTLNTTVLALAATQLSLAAVPASVPAGSCNAFTETRLDQYSNLAPDPGVLPVTLAGSGAGAATLAWFTEGTCTTSAGTAGDIAGGQASRTLYFISTTAGPLTLRASSSLTSPQVVTAVSPLSATVLVLSALPATINANACTALLETRQDQYFNNAPDAAALTNAFNATGAAATGLTWWTDAACTSAAADQNIAGGSATRQLYFKTPTAGALTLTATALTTPFVATTVLAPVMTKLVFVPPAGGSVKAGACSGLLTVQGQDATSTPVVAAADVPLTLTSNSTGTLTFHQLADCSDVAPGPFKIAAGGSTVQLAFSASKAPETPTLTVSAGGTVTNATQLWTVTAGDPTQLVWSTATPIAATRYACTPVSLQLQDTFGNVATATADVVATLASTVVAADVELFASSACALSAMGSPIATVLSGTSSTTFGMVGFGTGPTTLTATVTTPPTGVSSPPAASVTVTGAQGSLTVSAATTAGGTVEAGACQAVTITRRDSATTPVAWGAATNVTLASNDASLTVHTDAACNVAGGTLAIGPAASSGILYVRGRSAPSPGTLVTLTATEPSGRYGNAVPQSVTSLPLVRAGTCNMAAGVGTSTCAVSPALPVATTARSFLVFQAQGTSTNASSAHVECHLAVPAAALNVACSRVGTTNGVTVSYQVVSWGRAASAGGVTVQHLTQTTTAGSANPALVVVSPAVVPAESFVLFSSTATDGANEHSNVFSTARLDGGAQLVISNSAAFTVATYSAEVVDFAGAVVTRGQVANPTLPYSSLAVTGLASTTSGDVSKSFLLHSVRETFIGSGSDNNAICKRRFSGIADSAISLLFTRSAGAANGSNCNSAGNSLAVTELDWERIELPGASLVQLPATTPVALANGTGSADAGFATAVATHKSVMLLAGQGPGGQTAGESSDTNNNPLATLHALLSWSNTSALTVTRLNTTGTSEFYPYIVEFDP